MTIFAGVCEIAIASLVNRTRKLFPAVVSGVVIMAVGLEIGKIASMWLGAAIRQLGPSRLPLSRWRRWLGCRQKSPGATFPGSAQTPASLWIADRSCLWL
jgi:xanthine/uracil permease